MTVPEPLGFLNIHKAPGMTSHDVVAKLRRGLKLKKVGHAGTLDPMATGVLIVCVGAATRLSEYVMSSRKVYRAVVRAGAETDTYDAEGEITREADASSLSREQVEGLLPQFTGDLQQVPPMYSAIKQGGRKLYDLARAGQMVELQPRPVTIHALHLIDWNPPEFTLEVECSAGTYIRSLAFDMGRALGCGAHLSGLVRLSSGAFHLVDAVTVDAVLEAPDWQTHLIPVQRALAEWSRVDLTAAETADILHGRRIQQWAACAEGQLVMGCTAVSGDLIAILQAHDGWLLPHKVFSSADA
jgi:tRNA pseudouridine55 synthase